MATTGVWEIGSIKVLLTTVIVFILLRKYVKAYISISCQFSVQNFMPFLLFNSS